MYLLCFYISVSKNKWQQVDQHTQTSQNNDLQKLIYLYILAQKVH